MRTTYEVQETKIIKTLKIRGLVKLSKALSIATLVATVGFTSTSASGADLGSFSAPTSVDISNTITESGSFLDMHSFSVTSDATLAGVLASIQFLNIVGISGFVTSLWLGDDMLAAGVSTTVTDPGNGVSTTTSSIYYTPLLAGPPPVYTVRVAGAVVGSSGSYGGAMVLSPVPEPEIYALMAVGMGVMGWAARRKKREQAALV